MPFLFPLGGTGKKKSLTEMDLPDSLPFEKIATISGCGFWLAFSLLRL
jgi:hypothetical protein